MTARYEGVDVPGPLSEFIGVITYVSLMLCGSHVAIPFILSEVQDNREPRIFFTRGDTEDTELEDTFNLPGPNITVDKVVTIYAQVGL